ncbi:hypothetical protein K435DRAFT_875613 [Dendrothele bispora CBS 962.96]|uniref:GST N-terminal domain-containing protein n=1 Tax=Dendrothele bispora (strain CBS 962.96) TaxID=1314807 RepID=A0A4S8KUB6_DENBC|nr:hypothetical protein K435DRAFT_875613 [Dendrothele bispora CBS 962.96]
MITLYDMKTLHTGARRGISPHTWKVRFALRFKGIPYTLKCIEPGDIEAAAKSVGALPTGKKPDGSARYTVPFIQDSKTGKVISDSFDIVEYLDVAYPETISMVPKGTRLLQGYFAEAAYKIIATHIIPVYASLMPTPNQTRETAEWFRINRSEFGKLSPEQQKEGWEKFRSELGEVAKLMNETDVFAMGDKVSFADCVLFGTIMVLKFFWNEETTEWKEMMNLHGGRWSRLIAAYYNLPDVEVQPEDPSS